MARPKAGVQRPPHKAPAAAPQERGGKKKFDETNRGVLFENDKEGNEARPDVTGNITIQVPDDASPGDLVKFRLAGWNKESKNSGMTFVSLSASLPKDRD